MGDLSILHKDVYVCEGYATALSVYIGLNDFPPALDGLILSVGFAALDGLILSVGFAALDGLILSVGFAALDGLILSVGFAALDGLV